MFRVLERIGHGRGTSMAQLIPDALDWSVYARQTEASVKVRRAGEFLAEMDSEFSERRHEQRSIMFSTKLRDAIEFRPGELTCWAGYNGHRKSMFAGQVALDMCVQREKTLIASMEMSPGRTLARMVRQAYGVAIPSAEDRGRFAKWTDGRLWLFDHLGRVTPATIQAVCVYFANELAGRHVVIDSMMMVCGSEESLDEQKQFTTDLCRLSQETGLHVHLVTHCRKPQSGAEDKPPTKYDLRGSAAISDQASNVITIWANKAKKAKLDANPSDDEALHSPDAAVTVEKQRNGAWEGRLKLWWDDASLRFVDDRTSPIEPYRMLGV
jgi:twinkle protein